MRNHTYSSNAKISTSSIRSGSIAELRRSNWLPLVLDKSGYRTCAFSGRSTCTVSAFTRTYVFARETNSKSSYSSSWSVGMKVRPETIGSETNTPRHIPSCAMRLQDHSSHRPQIQPLQDFRGKVRGRPFLFPRQTCTSRLRSAWVHRKQISLAFAFFRFPCAEFQKFGLDPNIVQPFRFEFYVSIFVDPRTVYTFPSMLLNNFSVPSSSFTPGGTSQATCRQP
jgi:hypothetical protein